MPDLHLLLEQTAALHDHLCPRQVIGVRMGLYAAELLQLDLPQKDKRLYTFVETDGCFSDGVAVATGCWLGHRTMRLIDYGKVAATFVDTQTEHAIRIWPNPAAREHAINNTPDAESRWHAQLEAYQWLPTPDLLCASPVALNVSMRQIISNPGVREICAMCGEEIINEREVVADGKILCQSCAGESYWAKMHAGAGLGTVFEPTKVSV